MKTYHQQGVQLMDSNQGVDIIFGESNNYHQIGNRYLEFDITLKKSGIDFTNLSDQWKCFG